jgi:hypothetical protein
LPINFWLAIYPCVTFTGLESESRTSKFETNPKFKIRIEISKQTGF